MYLCIICHLVVPFDDTVASGKYGRCVCLRCYVRETGSELHMPPALRQDLSLALRRIAGSD